jgi:CRP-like cAMP-binding protein
MSGTDYGLLSALINKLKPLGPLDDGDAAAIGALPMREQDVPAGMRIVREGERVDNCCILLSGYACRSKMTSDGRRQIVSFHIPGDVLDLQHFLLKLADHNVDLITDCTVAWVPTDALRGLARDNPNIAMAMWRDTLIDASIFREWVLNVGQRDGRARVAHMLCEFAFRRAAAGHGAIERFVLPMTQEAIADATGMTPIHVSRMLRALRADGVIDRKKRSVEIIDWPKMQRIADFDPAYLHVETA